MFGWILALGTLAGFGGIAIHSALKTTGEKVEKGDSVFVPTTAIAPVDPASGAADVARFLAGFLSTSIKVTNVIPTGKGDAIGSIVGLSPPVKFSLSAVTKIERDGKQFT